MKKSFKRVVSQPIYYRLVIKASKKYKDIWLSDENGHLVQKGIRTLDTSLLPGIYNVEFGLGTTRYPIQLKRGARFVQAELTKGPISPPRKLSVYESD